MTVKKHSKRMAKKFKASRDHRGTFIEEYIAFEATSIGTASRTTAPFEARRLTVVYSLSISITTPSPISFPHTSLKVFSLPSTTLPYNIPYVLEPITSGPIHTSASPTL